jgi:hypothetical protein
MLEPLPFVRSAMREFQTPLVASNVCLAILLPNLLPTAVTRYPQMV